MTARVTQQANGEVRLRELVRKWRDVAGSRSEQPYIRATADTMKQCADDLEAALAAPVQAEVGAGAREEALFQAANTAATNLATSMNLREHPDSCECYGCRLQRAVVDFALARAKENVRPIVERELRAEKWGYLTTEAQRSVQAEVGAGECTCYERADGIGPMHGVHDSYCPAGKAARPEVAGGGMVAGEPSKEEKVK